MRPKPKVVLERYNKKTHRTHQILEAEAFYLVLHDGKPFNYKNIMTWTDSPNPKYYRNCFPSYSGARNLASKLNRMFNTDKFAACRATSYETIQGDGSKE